MTPRRRFCALCGTRPTVPNGVTCGPCGRIALTIVTDDTPRPRRRAIPPTPDPLRSVTVRLGRDSEVRLDAIVVALQRGGRPHANRSDALRIAIDVCWEHRDDA